MRYLRKLTIFYFVFIYQSNTLKMIDKCENFQVPIVRFVKFLYEKKEFPQNQKYFPFLSRSKSEILTRKYHVTYSFLYTDTTHVHGFCILKKS